jgi:hypothetical protein
VRADAAATAVVAGAVVAVVAASYYGLRANTWAVMTDELQVARLATSIADGLSLIPTIRGEYYGAHSQLYPLLLAPLYGMLDPPAAAAAAHVLNAVLLVSAAVPAFLLARSVAGSNAAGYVAATLTAITPWLVLSTTLLTENAAYPAFAWAVFLCHRALVFPSPRTDIAALGGLVLAFAARTQLLVLALALPVAVVLLVVASLARHEDATPRATLRLALTRHRVLVVAYAAGAVVAGGLVVGGSIGGIVGNYAVPFEGDLVPPGFWRAAAEHFVQVALGVGVVPVVLCLSWLVTTAIHPERLEARAFAALLVVLIPLLVLQVTSFDLRFTPGAFIQDRYLVYLVPLFAVGTAAWLTARAHMRTRLVTAIAAGACVAALLRLAPAEDTVIFWASPAAAFRPAIASASEWLGVSDVDLMQIATVVLVSAAVLAAWRAPRAALVGSALVLVAYGALQTGYVFDRYVEPSMVRADDRPRDWIDRVVPDGLSVALVPGGTRGPTAWWEAEFWNASVERELRVDHGPVHTPFPVLDVSLDEERAALRGPQPSEYLVLAEDEKRFGLVESAELASRPPLRLVRVPHPYRLAWATDGLTQDGWMRPWRTATIRLFGSTRPERRAVSITFAASRRSPRPVPFAVRGGGTELRDTVGPGGARPPVEVSVCVPPRGSVDIRLRARDRVTLAHGRVVSLHVERIALSDPWPCAAE